MNNTNEVLSGAVGSFSELSEGYYGQDKNYLVALNLAVASSENLFSDYGSETLDKINVFDEAEVAEANLGQINMMKVSSFCGPHGAVLGLDFFKAPNIRRIDSVEFKDQKIEVFDANPLVDSAKLFFGSREHDGFKIMPGSHTFCATKQKTVTKPGVIYTAIALNIPEDRTKDACLFMEDVGYLGEDRLDEVEELESHVISNLAKSVIQIGINQNITYTRSYIAVRKLRIQENEVGCALVAAPYFMLPTSVSDYFSNKNAEETTEADLKELVIKYHGI